MGRLTIGVLALQGAFAKHVEMLRKLDVDVIEVRKPADLERCDGLIIPGGESTTIMRQIRYIDLADKLAAFSEKKPIFGTCAGLILMSKKILSDQMIPFGIMDVEVERNAFGRQVESFSHAVKVILDHPKQSIDFRAVFIRAPRIKECGDDVKVLASFEGEPVLIQQGKHLGSTFHPELTDDAAIHKYFLKLVANSKDKK